MTSGSVLVLDTERQAGLSIVQSLGRRGVRVVASGPTEPTLGMVSRHADGRYVYPDPKSDMASFVDHLLDYLDRSSHDYVFAPSDQLSVPLAKYGDEIAATGATPASEDWERFAEVYDKARLFERMTEVDVPCPETHAPSDAGEVEEIAPDLSYPAVVKPRSKTHLFDNRYVMATVNDRNYAESPADLVETYRRLVDGVPAQRQWPPIVQEYVPGETTTTVVLADEGEVRAHFQERRLRTVPASGGSSTLLGVVDDERMLTYAERVIDELNWTGPAQVEFMERPNGEYVLIEVNGRYWGSLPFAINCGVDFPWLHYCQLRGETVSHDGDYRTDVIQRRTSEDIGWLAEQLSENNVRALGRFLLDFHRADHTFVSLSDPMPTAWALAQLPRHLLDQSELPTPGEITADLWPDGAPGSGRLSPRDR